MTVPVEEARAIIAMRKAGGTHRAVAAYFGRAKWTIIRVLRGEGPHASIDQAAIAADPDPDWPAKPVRCGGCGMKIRGDERCVICEALAARERHAGLDPAAVDTVMAELGAIGDPRN